MKTVIITGASQGLGQFIATAFAESGWRAIGTGRSVRPDSLDKNVEYAQFDASDTAATAEFWQQLELAGEVCLVNNAGGFIGGKITETNTDDYEKSMNSSFFTGVNMTRELARSVPKARIINVISFAALETMPGMGPYSAAKTAARQFFQALQKELPARNYQITNLYPSLIGTNGQAPGKSIDPGELAALILQLAESQASYYQSDITLHPAPTN